MSQTSDGSVGRPVETTIALCCSPFSQNDDDGNNNNNGSLSLQPQRRTNTPVSKSHSLAQERESTHETQNMSSRTPLLHDYYYFLPRSSSSPLPKSNENGIKNNTVKKRQLATLPSNATSTRVSETGSVFTETLGYFVSKSQDYKEDESWVNHVISSNNNSHYDVNTGGTTANANTHDITNKVLNDYWLNLELDGISKMVAHELKINNNEEEEKERINKAQDISYDTAELENEIFDDETKLKKAQMSLHEELAHITPDEVPKYIFHHGGKKKNGKPDWNKLWFLEISNDGEQKCEFFCNFFNSCLKKNNTKEEEETNGNGHAFLQVDSESQTRFDFARFSSISDVNDL